MCNNQMFRQALEQIENIGAESQSTNPVAQQMFKIANDALHADDISEDMSREIDEDLAAFSLYPVWSREVETERSSQELAWFQSLINRSAA